MSLNCFSGAWFPGLALLLAATSACASTTHLPDRTEYRAPYAADKPVVDGVADETVWSGASWQSLEHKWLGPDYSASDFKGRYKVVWTEQRIYILAEITDDILIDTHRDPLVQYWDDDCLEIFLDEDFSGGNHQFNHNAFAYHMSLDNQAIDIGTDQKPRSYSDHVESQWKQRGNSLVWEVSIRVYDDTYVDGGTNNTPVPLAAGKILGLMLAYCDNDGSDIRENFVGSEAVPVGPTDRGWIDAGLFGKLILTK